MTQQKSTNVTWHDGEVTRADRFNRLGQKGVTIWFTGLSGSGKSTVAVALEKALHSLGKLSYRLDGDNIRLGINKNLGFSAEDRTENIRRIGEISKLYCDTGIITLNSFISPYREDRQQVRRIHEEGGYHFIEVHVNCSLECAEARDPKGLYKKARAGKIKNFTGIDDPYEEPLSAKLVLYSNEKNSIDQLAKQTISFLEEKNIISLH